MRSGMCERGRENFILFFTAVVAVAAAPIQSKSFKHRTQSVFACQLTEFLAGLVAKTVKRSNDRFKQDQQQQWKRHEFLIKHLCIICPHTIFITFTQFIQKAVHAIFTMQLPSHTHTRIEIIMYRIERRPDHILLTLLYRIQMTHIKETYKRTHAFFLSFSHCAQATTHIDWNLFDTITYYQ